MPIDKMTQMAHLLRSRTLPAEIPIFNLTRQYQSLKKEINTALRQVYANSQFIQGPNVKLFAEKFAHYCEVRYCIPVANGTDALYLSLRALGIGPGDEVITSAFSFIAAAEAIVNAGATPVFADIDPLTFTISPDSVKTLVSSKTKALIPVHLYGLPADMDTLINIAQQNHLAVIEDAAQAHGARYKNRPSGSIGRTGCFSFYPTKNLGSFGDAGAVTTNDAALAQKIRSLANHGSGRSQYDHTDSGMNSRMDEIQAAILNVKLGYLEQWNRKRRQVAQYYSQAFSGISELTLPVEPPDRKHVFHLYTIRTPRRDLLLNYLKSQGVTTKIHYPAPLHLLAAYQKLAYASGSLPESECAAQEVLALPLFPEIKTSEVRRVCEAIKTFFKINLVFAVVAAAGLFTAACVAWALPKQPLAFPLEELSQAPLPPEKPFDAAPVLSIKFLSVNFVRFRGQIKPHWHAKRAETVISLSDGGTLVVDGEEYPLKTGSLFFIPRRAIHEARCPENKICRAYSIFAPPWNPDKPDRIFINP